MSDEQLLARLRQAAGRLDPIPGHVTEALRATLSWRSLDAELAELSYDSVLDDDRLAVVRGGPQPRLLTFSSPTLALELEVTVDRQRRSIQGQLVPPQPATVQVLRPDEQTSVEADEAGRFAVELSHGGPVSLRCVAGDAVVATDWLVL